MSSAYCALVSSDRPFPHLLFYQILLFCLHLRKYVNNFMIHPQNSTFAKFTADFSCNFTNFWPWMSRSNICLRSVSYVWTRYVSWNLENWVASKLWYFHYLGHSLFYWPFQLDKSCFQKNDLHKLKLVPRGTRMIYINYLKLCNTLLQIWCKFDVLVVIHNLFYYMKFGRV